MQLEFVELVEAHGIEVTHDIVWWNPIAGYVHHNATAFERWAIFYAHRCEWGLNILIRR